MRMLIVLSVLIVAVAAIYTLFGISSYDPPPVQPLSFETPLQSPALEEEARGPVIDPELEEVKDKAVAQIVTAIQSYDRIWPDLPPQAGNMQALILQSIKRGGFPALYPVVPENPEGVVNFVPYNIQMRVDDVLVQQDLTLDSESLENSESEDGDIAIENIENVQVEEVQPDYSRCLPDASIVLGDLEDNVMNCPPGADGISRIISTGPGKDAVATGGTQTFIEPGSGDDLMKAGPEQTTIILDSFEGQKKIEMDCSRASIQNRQLSDDYPLAWTEPFIHYIVFGTQIKPEDIIVEGNKITNKENGATLTFSRNCFNMHFTSNFF